MRHSFVHLHVHSHYSLLHSTNRLVPLVEASKHLGMRAIALTDSGNLFGAIEFYKTALTHGVKPIIGCELNGLTLLAQDGDGYRNLVALVSRQSLTGACDFDGHAKGLIALCGDTSRMDRYREIFGSENFFIELQDHGIAELLEKSKRDGIPTVATNNVRYLRKEDAPLHDALVCIGERSLLKDYQRQSDQWYLKSQEEMFHRFAFDPAALTRTIEIAERVSLEFDLTKVHLPAFPVDDENEVLMKEARSRLKKAGAAYEKRLDDELRVITDKGFAGYFLIVADFIAEARRRKMPVGPGRGSAAGSLVAYALGITEIDPLEHGLIFERFLNPERASLPDIDVDIGHEHRDELIEYVRSRYGRDRVAQIITFGTFGAKAVLRDVARILSLPVPEMERIVRLIPEMKMPLSEALEKIPDLAAARKIHPKLFEIAFGLEGLARHASRHAAGVVISNVPMNEIVPVYKDTDGHVLTQYDMKSVEALGLLKIDILGLKTLTVIADTRRMSGDCELPVDQKDPAVYQLLSSGRALGVFQLDSSGMRDLLTKVKPTVFEDLVALISLYRPGPMNLLDDFVARKHGRKAHDYAHPLLEPILKETYGIILYQEQVMEIAHRLGGFSLAAADDLRKAMSKKKHEMMRDQQERFIAGAIAQGIEEKVAAETFAKMERFAGYGFNKSHAVAYGVLAYQTAWLKVHHAAAFMSALLSREYDNRDKLGFYIDECRRMGLKVRRPHVNFSGVLFIPENSKAILYGLAAIKNVGISACEVIIKERENGIFKDLPDFLRRIILNARAIESLIAAGALDGLGPNRRSMTFALPELVGRAHALERDRSSGQIGLFGEEPEESTMETLSEFTDLPAREKEYLGFSLRSLLS